MMANVEYNNISFDSVRCDLYINHIKIDKFSLGIREISTK